MDFTAISNMNQFLNATKMKTLWHQKGNNPAQSVIPGDPKSTNPSGPGFGISQGDQRLSEIITKLQTGKDLSADDLEYLRENAPETYDAAIKAIKEKKQYESDLRSCKTKDDARMLQMGKVAEAFSTAKGAMARGDVGACISANAKLMMMTVVYAEFTKTKEYAEKAENYAELAKAIEAVEEEFFGKEDTEPAGEATDAETTVTEEAPVSEENPEVKAAPEASERIGEENVGASSQDEPVNKSNPTEKPASFSSRKAKTSTFESHIYTPDMFKKINAAKRQPNSGESEPVFQPDVPKMSLKV